MPTSQFSVAGDTAIVTGASSGIGKAIAESFAADGVDVVVCSRTQGNVDPVADAINESGDGGADGDRADDHGRALAVECDVREADAVAALVEATVDEFGGVDVLVNNAGASFVAGFEDISENGWHAIVDSNLTGTYHCTRAAAEHLKKGGGSVVNVASVAGQQGSPYMSHYGAAKAAIVNLTTSLANEWADAGVRVNCVAPGFVATPGVEQQMGVSAEAVDRSEVDRRVGTSEEIADVVQFLASDAASFVTGETLTAQGVPQVMETP